MAEGMIAAIRGSYYAVTPNQIVVFDLTTWGWLTLIWGIILVLVGFGLLAVGVVIAWQVGGVRALGAALGLACAIVLYDAWHKKNVLSPALMGACRVLAANFD